MKRLVWMVWLMVALAGCAGGQIYPYPVSPNTEGPPVRYPLDYPLCYSRPGGGTIIVPLHVHIYSAGVPDPMQVMSLRRKDPTADGCFIDYSKPPRPSIDKDDNWPAGWQSLDMSGRGFFSSVGYMGQLLNADDLREEAEHEEQFYRSQAANLTKFGKTYGDITLLDETEVINSLVWRHVLKARYEDVVDLNDVSKGELIGWRETYEYSIDSTHILKRMARYSAEVVADSEWIRARRALLRKMVEAVRIEKMTPAEVDAAVTEYNRQREHERADDGRRK